jgi:cytochrome c peroxidase
MASAKRRRLGNGLLVAIAAGALSFSLEAAGKQARSETGTAPSEAARLAPGETRPIPEAGPLAQAQIARPGWPPGLSADGTVACSTCHDPARAFTDGRPTSIGIKGRGGQRNAPTILNALYNKTQFWDDRVTTLEPPVSIPLLSLLVGGREYSS